MEEGLGGPSLSPSVQLAESALQARIREKLNTENIKLWAEPFISQGSTTAANDHEIMALASRYSTELGLPDSDILDALFSLQRNAIERLAERETYHQTGLATLRLKFSGFSREAVKGGASSRLQLNLSQTTGRELKKRIAHIIPTAQPGRGLKLICSGRVLDENQVLELQNVRNGAQVMVLSIATSIQEEEEQFRQLEETRGAADYLAGKDNEEIYSLQVADQDGKALDLPPAEKKALAVGLAFHEKGRRAMKNGDFSKALVFLLEADNVYSQCQSQILENVDNFGMLNLDVAWSYLNLQSISELPQTELRLAKCEQALHRSYGQNMERLINLKGSSGWEAVLFVRLHLLQGIAAYHQGQVEKSKFFIAKAEAELERLRVSDDQLANLINMGYTPDESRMALRSTYGNVQASVDWIIRKREEIQRIRREEAENIRQKKLQKKLGFTDNGQPVNVTLYKNLKEMGYDPALITPALKRTNNDINSALQLVSDPVFITSVIQAQNAAAAASAPSTSTSTAPGNSGPIQNLHEDIMLQFREILATMDGSNFPQDLEEILTQAQSALSSGTELPQRFRSLVEELGRGNSGSEFGTKLRNLLSGFQTQNPELLESLQDIVNEALPETPLSAAERERSEKAYEALSSDMGSEADYIDLALSAETAYVDQYKGLLQM